MKLRRRNWLNETRKQEYERRISALETSVQEAHSRINECFLNERVARAAHEKRVEEIERKLKFTAGGL